MVESNISTMFGCIYGEGNIGYLTLLQREKDALAIPTVVVERQCHSSEAGGWVRRVGRRGRL